VVNCRGGPIPFFILQPFRRGRAPWRRQRERSHRSESGGAGFCRTLWTVCFGIITVPGRSAAQFLRRGQSTPALHRAGVRGTTFRSTRWLDHECDAAWCLSTQATTWQSAEGLAALPRSAAPGTGGGIGRVSALRRIAAVFKGSEGGVGAVGGTAAGRGHSTNFGSVGNLAPTFVHGSRRRLLRQHA